MAGKFVLKKGESGKFHFNLLAGNDQVIAASQAYHSKESAKEGIESVRKNAPAAVLEDETSE
ncbi:MAG TPA: YegP family protein [Streptosporangiaceae bacterium]|nr:YegP family protein [Streptosporangiaceae bacterium]